MAITKAEFWKLTNAQQALLWGKMTMRERATVRDMSEVERHPFWPHTGQRIEWHETDMAQNERRRAWIGQSTGWRPVLITLHNRRSTRGDPARVAEKIVASSIRVINRGPR